MIILIWSLSIFVLGLSAGYQFAIAKVEDNSEELCLVEGGGEYFCSDCKQMMSRVTRGDVACYFCNCPGNGLDDALGRIEREAGGTIA